MASKTNRICILGIGRTGSTHLGHVLNNFSRFASFGELFEKKGCWGLVKHVPAKMVTYRAKNTNTDPALIAFAQANPRVFLDRVARVCRWRGKSAIAFQLFGGQLPFDLIETEVLSRPDTRAMLIARRAIDSFVSLKKAEVVSEWVRKDTTGLKIAIDAGAYADWHASSAAWYNHWISFYKARQKTLPVVRYERDIDGDLSQTLEKFSHMARSIGLDLHPLPNLTQSPLNRQDRTEDVRDRVSNWAEFERELSRRGLDEAAFGHFV